MSEAAALATERSGANEDLEQVVIADEVEARELAPLLLQEVVQRALTAVQLVQQRRCCLAQRADPAAAHAGQGEDERVALDLLHDGAKLAVDPLETARVR